MAKQEWPAWALSLKKKVMPKRDHKKKPATRRSRGQDTVADVAVGKGEDA